MTVSVRSVIMANLRRYIQAGQRISDEGMPSQGCTCVAPAVGDVALPCQRLPDFHARWSDTDRSPVRSNSTLSRSSQRWSVTTLESSPSLISQSSTVDLVCDHPHAAHAFTLTLISGRHRIDYVFPFHPA